MLKRLAQNTRGQVIVEFAICLPVLAILYTGGVSASDMIACRRKVVIATRSLVDIVSRTTSPTVIFNAPLNVNVKSHLSASAVVVAPYKLNNATLQISLLRVCDASHAYVVWTQAQTQNEDGSVVTPTTSTHIAGTLPTAAPQLANAVIPIPANMVSTTMIPTSPDGSNVCGNFAPNINNKTQVGMAGGWLYVGTITYAYTPFISLIPIETSTISETIFMVPRLY